MVLNQLPHPCSTLNTNLETLLLVLLQLQYLVPARASTGLQGLRHSVLDATDSSILHIGSQMHDLEVTFVTILAISS